MELNQVSGGAGNETRRYHINESSCIRCGVCEANCPTYAIDTDNAVIRQDQCVGCGMCAATCPYGCID